MTDPGQFSPTPVEESVQYVIPAVLRPHLDAWLASRRLEPVFLMHRPDDLPTYVLGVVLDPAPLRPDVVVGSARPRGEVRPADSLPSFMCKSCQTTEEAAPAHPVTLAGVAMWCVGTPRSV